MNTHIMVVVEQPDLIVFTDMLERRVITLHRSLKRWRGRASLNENSDRNAAIKRDTAAITGLVGLGLVVAAAVERPGSHAVRLVHPDQVNADEVRAPYAAALDSLSSECAEWLKYLRNEPLSPRVKRDFDEYRTTAGDQAVDLSSSIAMIVKLQSWLLEVGLVPGDKPTKT